MYNENDKFVLEKAASLLSVTDKYTKLMQDTELALKRLSKINDDITNIVKEKTIGFPWLADAFAQYLEMRDMKVAEYLDNKLRPALSASERVREMAKERRLAEKKFRMARNLVKYYESLFPWLSEYVDEDIDDAITRIVQANNEQHKNDDDNDEEDDDPVANYMTEGEYEILSITERNQLALDRYWSKKKSKWELGRDYERYVGYLYEKEGFSVKYQGIEEGLEDLGRDLIAKKSSKDVKIIQCKYWAKYKTIHEKHIAQLFGTTIKYCIENKNSISGNLFDFIKSKQIQPVFVTSTSLSEVARNFAEELGVEVKEQMPLERYPSIKCHISKQTKEKIYHLPMDQQYDKTILDDSMGEDYVKTVKEAEKLGFRRAWRWRGNKGA